LAFDRETTGMDNKFALQKAFVLHNRLYRETSLLVELLTQNSGRMTGMARGARRKKSAAKGWLQPFTPLLIQYRGRSQLPILTKIEPSYPLIDLKPKTMLIGFYLNELLIHTVPRFDKNVKLFELYENTLRSLSSENTSLEKPLRHFEKQLLQLLGYGIDFNYEAKTRKPLLSDQHYRFYPQIGFKLVDSSDKKMSHLPSLSFPGKMLLAIANDDYEAPNTLKFAKQLFRLAFIPLLEGKTLKTRELFL
jgi:DNA repair protein RecO (recombination protein O)